ncbi:MULTISPECIES: group II truncated hemoglobin [unclassified Novosphingobium]|uniref:group II truncated hemoglobin n=1 Tax=unclassified Novosphingobium TaxID=2644732 RepID=UPI00146D3D1D|nr:MULTISPECIES: group II truncated hemoglobin [unclassified Novosphingobium]NMN04448.1 hemoglobin [Novosphingobium sp. SG919]NMN85560.1 hemoglobin [Novosphingobium sp. SG916]
MTQTVPTEPETPAPSPYELLGGDAMVRAFVARFYQLMEELPGAAACRAVHPPSLERAQQRLFEYLTGWLGGPPLYTSQYGHPRLRMRHMVAPIGRAEIEGWLLCFHQAWSEIVPPSAMSAAIVERVEALAWHMGNQTGDNAKQR